METIKHSNGLKVNALLRNFIEHRHVQNSIVALILINAVLLGLETWPAAISVAGKWILVVDRTILCVFVIEIALRLYVYRGEFWRDPWSVFDVIIVSIALIPASGQFAVLRALRVLRVLRLLSVVPSMRRVVEALLAAIPGLGSIAVVLLVIYYVFAVIATNLFAAEYPEWFGHLGLSMYTLFQIMTLESWSMGIARPVMEHFPYAWAFFIPYILVATFTMLNLFIAVIVNAMQSGSEKEQQEKAMLSEQARQQWEKNLQTDLQQLHKEIQVLKMMLSQSSSTGANALYRPAVYSE